MSTRRRIRTLPAVPGASSHPTRVGGPVAPARPYLLVTTVTLRGRGSGPVLPPGGLAALAVVDGTGPYARTVAACGSQHAPSGAGRLRAAARLGDRAGGRHAAGPVGPGGGRPARDGGGQG